MFRKSRMKIVASIMGALILLLAVTLAAIVLSAYYENRKQSLEMLDRYVSLYSPDNPPGEEPNMPSGSDRQGPPDESSVFRLSTFYSAAISEQGEVLSIDAGQNGLYSESELIGIVQDILNAGGSSGKTGNLLYQVEVREGYTLVAFVDNTVIGEGLLSLTRHTLFAGGIALVVLFFVAVFLSGMIIKPLEGNDRRQKQFVSDAGHELKTPVSVISANAELLSRQLGANEWLDNIRYENERMGDLVTQLLDLSRAENAQVQTEELDLSRLVTGEALRFESVAFENGLSIRSKIDDSITFQGNRTQLSQLVSILLDNAVRHAEGGNEIGLSLHRQGRYAVLSVDNSGKEIPPDRQARLFERFYRLDEARGSEGNHYGLGLAIAKAISEAHGGSISVNCREGKVVFTVLLPLKNNQAVSM